MAVLGLLGCRSVSQPEPDMPQVKSAVGVALYLVESNTVVVPPTPMPDGDRVTCSECRGSGKASHLGATFDCPACNGKGWVVK